MAMLINADGTGREVLPKKGKEFSLEELQGFVGGYIELVRYFGGQMMVNEDGRPKGLPVNIRASELAGMPIVGPVVIGSKKELGIEG